MRRLPHRLGAAARWEAVTDAVRDRHAEDASAWRRDNFTQAQNVRTEASRISIMK